MGQEVPSLRILLMVLLCAASVAIVPGPREVAEAIDEAPMLILDPVPEYVGQNGFTFTGIAMHDSSPIASVEYAYDHGPWHLAMPVDAPFGDAITERFAFSIDALGEGAHLVEVRATTRAGYTTAPGDYAIASFVVDTVPPSVILDPLQPEPTADSTPELFGSAMDSGGLIALVEYRVDGGDWLPAQANDGAFDSPSEGFTVALTLLVDGEHTVTVRAADTAGNLSSPASHTFVVDTVPPKVSLLPGDCVSVYETNRVWKGTATDLTSAVIDVEYRVNGGDWVKAVADDGSFDGVHEHFTFTLSDLDEGEYLIEVKATDAAGNESSHASVSFVVATYHDQETETPDIHSQVTEDVSDRQNRWMWWIIVVPALGLVFLMLLAVHRMRSKDRLRIGG